MQHFCFPCLRKLMRSRGAWGKTSLTPSSFNSLEVWRLKLAFVETQIKSCLFIPGHRGSLGSPSAASTTSGSATAPSVAAVPTPTSRRRSQTFLITAGIRSWCRSVSLSACSAAEPSASRPISSSPRSSSSCTVCTRSSRATSG